MKVEQIYTGCLAEAAYYIESNGEAAIIDPLREYQPYVEMAEKNGSKIKYVFETHFHADFVSGHVDLAKATGAQIVFGPNAQAGYETIVAEDNQEFKIGNVTIKVLHTPGHTMESTTFLLLDENGKEHAIFTGDTLFLGDVGRPDLAVKTHLTQEDLASHLFDSLRNRIMTLPDETIVYPGHGAGSACGKNMSSETVGTLGDQKENNYALRADMTREEFIKEVTTGLVAPPQYFPKNVMMNKNGYESVDDVLAQGTQALELEDFLAKAKNGALILDVRHQDEFEKGAIPGSMFIGLDGSFAMWVGALIEDIKQEILLVVDEDRAEEAVTRLARVGYDNSIGFLKGGYATYANSGKEVQTINSITSEAYVKVQDKVKTLDVRKNSEYLSEHQVDAYNLPLDFIFDNMKEVDQSETQYVHCAGGYRSMIAASIYAANGITDIVNIKGGFKGIKEAGANVTEYVCPSTLL